VASEVIPVFDRLPLASRVQSARNLAVSLAGALLLAGCAGGSRGLADLTQADVAPAAVAETAIAPAGLSSDPAMASSGVEPPVVAQPVAVAAANSAPLPQAFAAPQERPQTVVADNVTTASIPANAFKPAVLHPKFGDYKPFDFPNRKPTDYAVHGTDTSRWQPSIQWPKVRQSGISFAFIKATEGGDHKDPAFAKNWKAAKTAGVPRGAYHFYYFCTAPEVQAAWYLRNVPRDKFSMPPVLDAEWNHQSRTCPGKKSPERVRRDLHTWLKIVEKATGKRPIIYTTPDFYDDNDMGRFEGYHFWLRSTAAHPTERYPHEKWTFWQYTGTGKIPGIEGKADINVFRGSAKEWAKWLKDNGVRG
jgi:lysozyme